MMGLKKVRKRCYNTPHCVQNEGSADERLHHRQNAASALEGKVTPCPGLTGKNGGGLSRR